MYVNYISVNRTQSIKEGENVSYRKRYHKQNLETNRENICKQDMNLSKFWETVKAREAWRAAVSGDAKSWT